MQSFDAEVQRAARNGNLTAPYRFALLRMAELLDEAAPVGVSAALMVDTQTVVAELDACLHDYLDPSSKYQYNQLERAMEGATFYLRRDPNLRTFYGHVFTDLLADLARAENIRKLAMAAAPRRARFNTLWQNSLAVSFARFRDRVSSTGTDYRHKLRARLTIALRTPTPTDSQWNRLDGDLNRLCGGLLADGRHGPSVVAELAVGLRTAADVAEAERCFKRTVAGHPRHFQVVVFIDGLRGRAVPSADGLVDLSATLRWQSGTSKRANKRLRDLGRRVIPPRGMAMRARVVASDAGQARRVALEMAERVVTRILHEHRVGDIDLLPGTVVLDERSGAVRRLPTLRQPLRSARVSTRGHLAPLGSAMHYFGLGRRDASALGANVSLWTALENLAQGYGQPKPIGSFVPEHIGPIAALVGGRQLFIHARRLLALELQQPGRADPNRVADWLGLGRGGAPDLRRVRDILVALHSTTDADATTAAPLTRGSNAQDAARALRELLSRCSIHVRRRVGATAALAADHRRFLAHLDDIGTMAAHHSDRMRIMRNRTVHQTLVTADRAFALRQVGLLLVDAVLELLPTWTRIGEPPHRAMHRALVWRGNLRNRWASGETIDPDSLVVQPRK